MTAEFVLWLLLTFCVALIVYHHIIFPVGIAIISRFAKPHRPSAAVGAHDLPTITMIIPAYREARYIRAKIDDLIAVVYPKEKLRVVIGIDGSPDDTAAIASAALAAAGPEASHIRLISFEQNRGKVAVLNDLIGRASDDIVVLSDASAVTEPDLLLEIVRSFVDPEIGVVCPAYALNQPGSKGEASYWRYQSRIKEAEGAIGAPMGAHGATYAFRRNLWQSLPVDVINDDFVLPMQIVAQGHRAVYRSDILSGEREKTTANQESGRRRRIGAGNLQQVWLCRGLFLHKDLRLVALFASGKVLRALMPLCLMLTLLASLALAVVGQSTFAIWPLVIFIACLQVALTAALVRPLQSVPLFAQVHHVLSGYYHAGCGGLSLMCNSFADERRPDVFKASNISRGSPFARRVVKRALDIVIASIVLVVFLILLPFIAAAVKLSSPGPVFYRQLRVGQMLFDRTELFQLLKFRTMTLDAETGTGAVWASKQDPRVTRVGRFLRKTRLDELPQCINVLRGEMSIVGPRPERPVFFSKLESAIPFYTERTFGLKPGVTGLAQVSTGYDATIEDVRLKIIFDHAYAAKTDRPLQCLVTDLTIMWRTIWVMGLGMGR